MKLWVSFTSFYRLFFIENITNFLLILMLVNYNRYTAAATYFDEGLTWHTESKTS